MTAASATPLTFQDALSVLQDLLERHKARHGAVPDAVVVLGGTALGAARIRATSLDVNLYMPDVDADLVSETWKLGIERFGPKFRLDGTPEKTAWGPMTIHDIEGSAQVADLTIGSTSISVRALSPETVYVLKCEVRRDKDERDLGPIAASVGPDRLIDRFNKMIRWHGDFSRIPQLTAYFRDSLVRHCRLKPDEVLARLTVPETFKERVREFDAADQKKIALLLAAGFRRAADTIRQTVVHGQTRFQIDGTRLPPEVQRLALERPMSHSR